MFKKKAKIFKHSLKREKVNLKKLKNIQNRVFNFREEWRSKKEETMMASLQLKRPRKLNRLKRLPSKNSSMKSYLLRAEDPPLYSKTSYSN